MLTIIHEFGQYCQVGYTPCLCVVVHGGGFLSHGTEIDRYSSKKPERSDRSEEWRMRKTVGSHDLGDSRGTRNTTSSSGLCRRGFDCRTDPWSLLFRSPAAERNPSDTILGLRYWVNRNRQWIVTRPRAPEPLSARRRLPYFLPVSKALLAYKRGIGPIQFTLRDEPLPPSMMVMATYCHYPILEVFLCGGVEFLFGKLFYSHYRIVDSVRMNSYVISYTSLDSRLLPAACCLF